MKLTTLLRCRSLCLAALTMLLLTGCANDRFANLVEREREAGLVEQALTAADKPETPLPDQPADCPKPETAMIKSGERLDVALVKTDAALDRANAKAKACSDWYASIKKGTENEWNKN